MRKTTTTMDKLQTTFAKMDIEDIRKANELLNATFNDKLSADVSRIAEKQLEAEREIAKIKETLNKVCVTQEEVDIKINNLRQAENSHYCKTIRKKVGKQCYKFIIDKSHVNYSLFSPYIFKSCYHDIAEKFNLGSWLNLCVKDAEEPNSKYQQVCAYVDKWVPTNKEVTAWTDKLIKQRDAGLLKAERCRALTVYLDTHNARKNTPLLP